MTTCLNIKTYRKWINIIFRIKLTKSFELVSTESIRSGALMELFYTVEMDRGVEPRDLVNKLTEVNTGQRVTVLSGYDQTDL